MVNAADVRSEEKDRNSCRNGYKVSQIQGRPGKGWKERFPKKCQNYKRHTIDPK